MDEPAMMSSLFVPRFPIRSSVVVSYAVANELSVLSRWRREVLRLIHVMAKQVVLSKPARVSVVTFPHDLAHTADFCLISEWHI
jgi:hypothetical protein